MTFEWDDSKNISNIKKHGISFEEVVILFVREDSIIFDDPDHSDDEERFLIIGFSYAMILCIVSWCERKKDTIRIISARRATRSEITQFYDYQRGAYDA